MPRIEGIIKKAHFVFDDSIGLALHIDVYFNERLSTGYYMTKLNELNEVKDIVCNEKTGYSRQHFSLEDLDELKGYKIVFYNEEDSEDLHFKWIYHTAPSKELCWFCPEIRVEGSSLCQNHKDKMRGLLE